MMQTGGKGGSDVEQQLADLHRKYRIMESNRKNFSEVSQDQIRRQRAAIEKLKADNAALKEELSIEQEFAQAPDKSVQEEINALQKMADTYTRKIELERRKVDGLDKQIHMCETKVMEQRHRMGGINAAKENNQQVAKRIKVLENRLDKALVKFNEALSSNKTLREEIDNLRRERVVFDQIYKKMERELGEKKKEIANVIEISNIAYEARDQAQNEMAALRAQADKEQAAFESEWRELGKLIEADRKMESIMKSKEQQKHVYGEMSVEDEAKLRKKVIRGNWGLAKDTGVSSATKDKVESYEEAFKQIRKETGMDDIDQLVTQFIEAEERHVRHFKHLSELNSEMEKLEENLSDLYGEMERIKGAGSSEEGQRKKVLKELEEKLSKTEQRAESYEQRHAGALKTVNSLKQTVYSLFNKIGCNTPASREVLGDTSAVTEQNMLQFMSVIEQRANDVLQMFAASQMQSGSAAPGGEPEASRGALFTGPSTPAGQMKVDIGEPPSTADEYASEEDSEEEVDDRPLSREELHQKTLRNINKRESRGGNRGGRKKK